jgi:hypothetical protein
VSDPKKQKFDFTDNPGTTFESALPLIFEDVSNANIDISMIPYFIVTDRLH